MNQKLRRSRRRKKTRRGKKKVRKAERSPETKALETVRALIFFWWLWETRFPSQIYYHIIVLRQNSPAISLSVYSVWLINEILPGGKLWRCLFLVLSDMQFCLILVGIVRVIDLFLWNEFGSFRYLERAMGWSTSAHPAAPFALAIALPVRYQLVLNFRGKTKHCARFTLAYFCFCFFCFYHLLGLTNSTLMIEEKKRFV